MHPELSTADGVRRIVCHQTLKKGRAKMQRAVATGHADIPVKQIVLTLFVALLLSYGVSHANRVLVTGPRFEARLEMHQEVLDGEAYMPYQFHMYLVAHLSQWIHDYVGLTLVNAFYGLFLVGYTLLFLSLWALLLLLYRKTTAILLGLFALAFYALLLLHQSYDHPADPFGAAILALTLAAALRGSVVGIALTSVAGGFFWSKQVILAPVIWLYEGLQARWGRAFALALVIGAASYVGQLVYQLPSNPIVPKGILAPADWLATLPRAAQAHLGFALLPLLSLLLLRSRLHPILKAATLIYPLMLAAYALHGFFIYELRSFWPVVPVFACLIGAWGEWDYFAEDTDSPEAAAPGDSPNGGREEAEAGAS
jgi:hypothetical protein